ncbi:MAG: radical SAM protein, partial [Gemmatimonadales bacterium]
MRGAKYPAAPLGLITLAALLPDSWSMKLVDLNTTQLVDRDIDEADLVFIGGMLPQQANFLALIDRVHSRGKKVVAGGPDPTSQPEIYRKADFLVLGEVENSITTFLSDLAAGAEHGTYYPDETRPDITTSPVPRFDLLDFGAYLMVGIQTTRGCPYNCEFCDIIELYGRKPRTKTPEQLVAELEALYRLGYRGHVDFVDDNFIGNKRKAKAILEATRDWSRAHGFPFCFSTEASINLADNDELLTLMRETDFRYVFVGIESSDEHVLASTNKKTNLRRDIVQDIQKILRYGIVVNGGFIVGFDDETSASVRMVTETIDGGRICMAMIGLLYALPNTQLTRRLAREGRLLTSTSRVGLDDDSTVDQATSGLNFTTKRPRSEVYQDYKYVLETVYAYSAYFDRCLQLGLTL